MARGLPIDGCRGERDAENFLKKQGYKIIARNFTCPIGEIDLVALCGGTLSFIEVKARAGTRACPQEAVNAAKQRKIGLVAEYFISKHKLAHHPCRFDVVAINYADGAEARIEHFQDAFEPA